MMLSAGARDFFRAWRTLFFEAANTHQIRSLYAPDTQSVRIRYAVCTHQIRSVDASLRRQRPPWPPKFGGKMGCGAGRIGGRQGSAGERTGQGKPCPYGGTGKRAPLDVVSSPQTWGAGGASLTRRLTLFGGLRQKAREGVGVNAPAKQPGQAHQDAEECGDEREPV